MNKIHVVQNMYRHAVNHPNLPKQIHNRNQPWNQAKLKNMATEKRKYYENEFCSLSSETDAKILKSRIFGCRGWKNFKNEPASTGKSQNILRVNDPHGGWKMSYMRSKRDEIFLSRHLH